MFREQIRKALQKVTEMDAVQVDVPVQDSFGDYSSNVALQMKGRNPKEMAEEIKKKLEEDKELTQIVEKIEIAGPGFLNFWIKKEALLEAMTNAKMQMTHKDKKVVVEYSSPNIAKPFTIGHLRSTIIGDSIANLLEATGATVYRDNHLGDWGTQFGKQIYAIKTWGSEDEIEKSQNPVNELVKLYVKFHDEAEKDPAIEDKGREWFKKLEEGDPEARRLWQKCVDWSFKEFERIYSVLGIKHTENGGRGYGESFSEDKIQNTLDELKAKDLLKEGKEGAFMVFFPNDKYPALMILKKDGTTLYSTRDLALDKWRLEYYGKGVIIINEVGMEQTLYFQQLYETEYMLGWYKPGQRVHIKHGHFRFADRKMSTRKGNVIWLNDVVDEAIKRASLLAANRGQASLDRALAKHSEVSSKEWFGAPITEHVSEEQLADITSKVAIGALKWNELKRDPIKDIVFDWDEILNMEGNSGPYLQYTYARTQSVLQKSKIKMSNIKLGKGEFQLEPEELSVLRMLQRFCEVVQDAAETYSPNLLCNYLYELAQRYNAFYNKYRILEAESSSKDFRLALTEVTGTVLKNGLKLLGIEAPDRM